MGARACGSSKRHVSVGQLNFSLYQVTIYHPTAAASVPYTLASLCFTMRDHSVPQKNMMCQAAAFLNTGPLLLTQVR